MGRGEPQNALQPSRVYWRSYAGPGIASTSRQATATRQATTTRQANSTRKANSTKQFLIDFEISHFA